MIVNKVKQFLQSLSDPIAQMQIYLLMSSFWLPFGYDAIFKLTMNLTGSYWKADVIFYCISGIFFLLYLRSRHIYKKGNNGKK